MKTHSWLLLLWLALGLVTTWTAQRQQTTRTQSKALYGDARSMRSAAPDGLMAFAQTLERLGYAVRAHRSAGGPRSDALVLLAPSVKLSAEERRSLLDWLEAGGRLIYAPEDPSHGNAADDAAADDAATDDTAADDAAADDASSDAAESDGNRNGDETDALVSCALDSLCRALTEPDGWDRARPEQRVTRGQGRAVVLAGRGAVLANDALEKAGLGPQSEWLAWVLAGAREVAFDEARIGAATGEGIVDLLLGSRFAGALGLLTLALVATLIATASRRSPPQSESVAGSRDFGEHFDALGTLLARDGRETLARQLLVDGTRSRLGARVGNEEVARVLSTVLPLAEQAATLAALETGSLDAAARFADKPRS